MRYQDADRQSLSFFQIHCVEYLLRVLQQHDIHFSDFLVKNGGELWISSEFMFKEKKHLLQISGDHVVMWAGEQAEELFEPYLSSEFKTDRAMIEGFSSRLDRYLGGGDWAGPDEPTLPEMVRNWFRKLFRRT